MLTLILLAMLGDVVVVDGTTIQSAVDVAAEGDTILVLTGSYAGFTVDGKSLAITRDTGAVVDTGPILIQNLAADQFVSLRGIAVDGMNDLGQAVELRDNAGSVWLEECDIVGSFDLFGNANDGVLAHDCDDVAIVRCDVTGGSPFFLLGSDSGGIGVASDHSNVHLFESTVTGGAAFCQLPDPCQGFLGGPGLWVSGGFVHAEGSTIAGGNGGSPCALPCFDCGVGQGGDGIHLVSFDPEVVLFDTTAEGGGEVCNAAGDDVVVTSGTLTEVAGRSRSFSFASPVREGEVSSLEFDGENGDVAILLVGLEPAAAYLPKFKGVLMVDAPQLIDIGASASVPYTGPNLLGFESVPVVLQAAFVPSGGKAILADPGRLVLLDGSF